MTAPMFDRRHALISLGAIACAPLAWGATVPELPGNSVYQLQAALTDQDGRAFELAAMRGNPVLVSMFYSSCEMVCPLIFETIRMTLQSLPGSVKVLMLSFDPARDSVAVLKKTAQAHACDARWTLARGDDNTVRNVAALLGIQYRRLASGEFNHSSTIELLDNEGRIVARSATLGAVDPALVKAARQIARG
jgi:protein SCO1/2